MNKWWSGLLLKSKLQIPIQLVLIVVLTMAQVTALDRFEEHVLEGARGKAVVSADGVINRLNLPMLNGIISQEGRRTLPVKKMGASEHVLELRSMRNKPVQGQFGPGMPSEQPVADLDRLAMSSAKRQRESPEKNGVSALRVVVPFIAGKDFRGTNCLMCQTVPEGTDRVAKLSNECLERSNRGRQNLQDMMRELELAESSVQDIAIDAGKFVSNTQNITNMTQQVRDIAEKSAQSAMQIDEVTQAHIREVTSVLMEANSSVDGVNRGPENNSASINRQRDAGQEITSNVDQIADMASRSNDVVKRMAVAAKSTEELAANLNKTVGCFKV